MSETSRTTCGTCGRPPRADGSACLGDEWVNPEAPAVRQDCTRFGRALLEPRVYHTYLTIECERAGRLAALARVAAIEQVVLEECGSDTPHPETPPRSSEDRLRSLLRSMYDTRRRANAAEAELAELHRLSDTNALSVESTAESSEKADVRVEVLEAFVRAWDSWQEECDDRRIHRPKKLEAARAAVGEVSGE